MGEAARRLDETDDFLAPVMRERLSIVRLPAPTLEEEAAWVLQAIMECYCFAVCVLPRGE